MPTSPNPFFQPRQHNAKQPPSERQKLRKLKGFSFSFPFEMEMECEWGAKGKVAKGKQKQR